MMVTLKEMSELLFIKLAKKTKNLELLIGCHLITQRRNSLPSTGIAINDYFHKQNWMSYKNAWHLGLIVYWFLIK